MTLVKMSTKITHIFTYLKLTHNISQIHRYSTEILVNQALYQLVNCHLSHA